MFGRGAQCVVVHVGGCAQPGEGIAGVAGLGGGRGLGVVAGQRPGEHVDGGVGVGGFGGEDAVRVGFGGGEVEVVFGAAAGQGDIQQLAAEPVAADDMAGVGG
jgi:hypothetical protein